MNSLVADYGTSSSESDSDKSEAEDVLADNKKHETRNKLPKPDFDGSTAKKSVFSNPFVEAENAKKAILEKHVKMVPTKDKVDMINGKKICWNYRKGRCHFGHNCAFAHDTDLQRIQENPEQDTQIQSNVISETNQGTGKVLQNSGGTVDEGVVTEDGEDKWENQNSVRRKRPGLTPGLVPSKKAMKFYKKTKEPK